MRPDYSDEMGYKLLAMLMAHQGLERVHIPLRAIENFGAVADSRGGMVVLVTADPDEGGLVFELVDMATAERRTAKPPPLRVVKPPPFRDALMPNSTACQGCGHEVPTADLRDVRFPPLNCPRCNTPFPVIA